MPRGKNSYRPDKDGTHRSAFEKNKKRIFATQEVCGICGRPVDFTLKFPHPMSACIDHIIPIDKGGHPSDINNLQLAHLCCNREKSDRIFKKNNNSQETTEEVVDSTVLPLSLDWLNYRTQQ